MDKETQLPLLPSLTTATLRQFINCYPGGIVFTNDKGEITYANHVIETIFGIDSQRLIGSNFSVLITPGRAQQTLSAFQCIAGNKKSAIAGEPFETRGLHHTGHNIPIEISFNVMRADEGALKFRLIRDISKRIELQKQLYHRAITDPLTGLFNRRHFNERLSHELKRTSRYRRPFSVIIIDIDGFKQANDLHGHPFGDEMLVKATKLFQIVLRQGDSVYRYGGDEFAMLLPETCKENCTEVAQRLKRDFAKHCSATDKRIKLSLSIGIASYPEDGHDEKSLMTTADNRMYHSKENGGNLITAYDNLSQDTGAAIRTLAGITYALEQNRGVHTPRIGSVNHSQSIRSLALEIGIRLDLKKHQLTLLEQAAMLHDVGCMYISTETLTKKERLTESEWENIKRHPLIGEEIVDALALNNGADMSDLKNVVGQHHERIDGSGYPRGLKGDEISLEAKILAVSDAYNAMLSKRPYRDAMSTATALEEIQSVAGSHYDTQVVDTLVKLETRR